jgi:hypothetical protein
MNLEAEILREHSKRQSLRIANWIGDDPGRFHELMELFFRGEYRITQRAAWTVCHCASVHPNLIKPWLKKMIRKARESGVHEAVPRNVFRIVEGIEIPSNLLGEVTTMCFDYLISENSPIAVKVYSMAILAKISRREPDLKKELCDVIEHMLPHSGPALQARGKKVLKQIGR